MVSRIALAVVCISIITVVAHGSGVQSSTEGTHGSLRHPGPSLKTSDAADPHAGRPHSHADPHADQKITSLPGFGDVTSLGFSMYSGYITYGEALTKNTFFWFVESAGDPSTDPVVLWMTGGPGCSSLFALITEHGPFKVAMPPQDPPNLSLNPFSWNTQANIIYVEAPLGVGFSYDTSGNYTTGDDITAANNLEFLVGWFEQYPEFQSNDFYLAGESYGGHYVPQLGQLVATDARASNIKFEGFMVGNPSFDFANDVRYYWPFMANHGLVSMQEFAALNKACNGTFGTSSSACTDAENKLRSNLIGINPYDIYAPCDAPPSEHGGCLTTALADIAMGRNTNNLGSQTFVPCVNITAEVEYFRLQSVRDALHVRTESFVWDVCSSHINYTQYAPTVAPIYLELMGTKRILAYSGDVDSCVVFQGTELNMDQLGVPTKTPFAFWKHEGQIAGYFKAYATAPHMYFATVKGAGHMAATYKPKEALALFSAYLADDWSSLGLQL